MTWDSTIESITSRSLAKELLLMSPCLMFYIPRKIDFEDTFCLQFYVVEKKSSIDTPPISYLAHIQQAYFPHARVSEFLGWWNESRAILTVWSVPVNRNVMKCPDQFHSAAWQGVRGPSPPLGKLHCWHQSWAVSPWEHAYLHFTGKKNVGGVVNSSWRNSCRTVEDNSRPL